MNILTNAINEYTRAQNAISDLQKVKLPSLTINKVLIAYFDTSGALHVARELDKNKAHALYVFLKNVYQELHPQSEYHDNHLIDLKA